MGDVTVVYDDVINNVTIPRDPRKGLVRSAIVVFQYGGNAIWCYESCESFALFV